EEESLPARCETWLLAPVLAPDFSLTDQRGQTRSLSANRGKTTLLNFSASESGECRTELAAFEKYLSRWGSQGLQVISIYVDGLVEQQTPMSQGTNSSRQDAHLSFPIVRASEDIAAIYNILYRQLFDRHCDLRLPTSFLINGEGYIVKVYQGTV